jgi:branched-chain amino acid transport system ATP-binding protein
MSRLLVVNDIHTYYGESYVLQGLSLSVDSASVVSLVGRNGMGKTTTIRSVMGFTPARRGSITFRDEEITGRTAFEIARKGLALVPQGRRIFPSLTVRENLAIAGREPVHQKGTKGAWDRERVLSLFPALGKRLENRGNQLSGGEQQMLAIGRALISNPALILMDEPSEGLAPLVIQEVGRVIKELKQEGVSILLAEQNLPLAVDVADYMYVINKGTMVFEGTPAELQAKPEIEREYLAV